MLNELISAVLQVFVFTLIPFMVFIFKTRSVKGFLEYIGLKKSNRRANLLAVLITLILSMPILFLPFINHDFLVVMTNPESVSGKIRQMGLGVGAILTILIEAILKTSFAEEIFFRGFIAKRFIAITNFQLGNIIQAFIFGAIHTLLFVLITHNVFILTSIFIFTAVGAYFMTFINEKLANGSIIPGWIAHGSANVISFIFFAFII
jgi:uncharacterized protein